MRNCSALRRAARMATPPKGRAGQPPGAPAPEAAARSTRRTSLARVQGRLARLLRDREAIIAEVGETTVSRAADGGVDHALIRRCRTAAFARICSADCRCSHRHAGAAKPARGYPRARELFLREICAGLRLFTQDAVALFGALPAWRCRGGQRCRAQAPARRVWSNGMQGYAASRSRMSWRTCGSTAAPVCVRVAGR